MLRKDYLVRQFEEFGKFMAIILGFRQQLQWTEHEEKIREALKQFTALEILVIEDLPNDQFFERLNQNGQLNDEQLKMVADLLFEKSYYYLNQNESIHAHNVLSKAGIVYKYITEAGTGTSFDLDTHFKLKNIETILKQID
jgi:hypothetical protein